MGGAAMITTITVLAAIGVSVIGGVASGAVVLVAWAVTGWWNANRGGNP